MAKVVDCCIWCHKICTRPATFDNTKHFLVCSDQCRNAEANFRLYFSDSEIGERNMRDFGVNPNHRGKHGKKEKGT